MMNLSLKGKTSVVCGSTQGIGKATALELADLGSNVVLVARNESKLKAVLTELSTDENQVHSYIVADFSQPDSLKKLLDQWIALGSVFFQRIGQSTTETR